MSLALMFCLSLGCVADVYADRTRDILEAKRRCDEKTHHCRQATASARTSPEYDKAAEVCREGVIDNRDLIEDEPRFRNFLDRHDRDNRQQQQYDMFRVDQEIDRFRHGW
jgi:hypothetical protein